MIVLVRGLPGSGKTTEARAIARALESQEGIEVKAELFSADDYFYGEDRVYRFDPNKLPEAHAACQQRVKEFLAQQLGDRAAVVHNTFSQRWEMEFYMNIAVEAVCSVQIVDVDSGLSPEELAARNLHGVPVETIEAMAARWEPTEALNSYDSRPPWERV